MRPLKESVDTVYDVTCSWCTSCVASFSSAALSVSSPISYDVCVVHSSNTWEKKNKRIHIITHSKFLKRNFKHWQSSCNICNIMCYFLTGWLSKRHWVIMFIFINSFLCENGRCKRSLHWRLWKKSFLLSDKGCVVKASDRLPGLLNCPGTPGCYWTTNNDTPSSVLTHAYQNTLASTNYHSFWCSCTDFPKHTHNFEDSFIRAEDFQYVIQTQLWASSSPLWQTLVDCFKIVLQQTSCTLNSGPISHTLLIILGNICSCPL